MFFSATHSMFVVPLKLHLLACFIQNVIKGKKEKKRKKSWLVTNPFEIGKEYELPVIFLPKMFWLEVGNALYIAGRKQANKDCVHQGKSRFTYFSTALEQANKI